MRCIGALVPLAALMAGGLALRAVALDRVPLWLDEGFSLLHVTDRPLSDWRLDVHPPLYYALLWAWAKVSTGDAWLRLLSALLGAATIPAIDALGARLLGRAAGRWAAAFLAVMWIHVWYSREARMYPLLVLAFALALWGLIAGARDGLARGWVVYAAAGAAMAWSHAVGIYYAAIVAGLGLAVPRAGGAPRLGRRWLAATGAMLLLYAPWIPVAVARAREVVASYWIPAVNPEPPVFTTLHWFTVAPIHSPAALARSVLGIDPGAVAGTLLGAWLWMVPVLAVLGLAIARAEPARRPAVGLLAAAYLAPLGLFTAMSLVVRPLLISRILLPVVVPLALLLAAGVQALPWRRARPAAGIALALVLLLGVVHVFRRDMGVGEGWRDASRHVAAAAGPGDVLLFVVPDLTFLPGSAAMRALSTQEMLLLRYDASGRLARVPRLATHRVEDGCRSQMDACLDAALRAAGASAGTHVWLIRRGPYLPPAVEPWIERRLEPAPVTEFHEILVARRQLRP